jgi:hypothetical protein
MALHQPCTGPAPGEATSGSARTAETGAPQAYAHGMSELEGRGAVWTEERGTSDEGRRCPKAPRKRAGDKA